MNETLILNFVRNVEFAAELVRQAIQLTKLCALYAHAPGESWRSNTKAGDGERNGPLSSDHLRRVFKMIASHRNPEVKASKDKVVKMTIHEVAYLLVTVSCLPRECQLRTRSLARVLLHDRCLLTFVWCAPVCVFCSWRST